MVDATPADLRAARKLVGDALTATPDDPRLVAQLAYVEGMSALLYGMRVPSEAVFAPVASGAPGFRAWARGKVAFELTRASKPEELVPLEALLRELPADDPWRTYLEARVALLRGDRVAARALLVKSKLAVAETDLAMLIADEGTYQEALEHLQGDYGRVLRELLHSEGGDWLHRPGSDLDGLDLETLEEQLPKLAAYRQLTRAQLGIRNRSYEQTASALAKLGQTRGLPNECWFWERVAAAHLALGRSVDKTNDHKIAGIARGHCAALGKATGTNHLLQLVDAQLQLGIGRPEVAQRIAAKVPDLRGRVIEAQAALELGHPARVPALLAKLDDEREFLTAVEIGKVLRDQAAVQLATGKARDAALVDLAATADQGVKQRSGSFSRPVAGDQRARQALGAAYVAIGDLASATRELRRVVEETSVDRPDPYAYRTHQLLAEVAIAQSDLALADAEIEAALKIHPGNAYSRVVQAKIKLRANDPDGALETLAPLRKGSGHGPGTIAGELPPAAKLVVAEALVTRKDVTADQRAQAKALVTEVAGTLQPAEVGRVAALIDPKLPAELALPIAKLPKQKT